MIRQACRSTVIHLASGRSPYRNCRYRGASRVLHTDIPITSVRICSFLGKSSFSNCQVFIKNMEEKQTYVKIDFTNRTSELFFEGFHLLTGDFRCDNGRPQVFLYAERNQCNFERPTTNSQRPTGKMESDLPGERGRPM
jgi:hypothetical protein